MSSTQSAASGEAMMVEYKAAYARCQHLRWALLDLADSGLVTLPPARPGCDPLDGLQLDIAPGSAG